jgi:hypothetical protein
MTRGLTYEVRRRPPLSARELSADLPPPLLENLRNADRILAQPYVGVTTDGIARTGLFPIQKGLGVSAGPVRDAARAWLACLDAEKQAAASFPIESDAWQRWNNTHPFQMRHGVCLEGLSDDQREKALDVLRATFSARGFQTARDIMRLNYTIGEITESWTEYGEWVYWLSIFGAPSESEPWGWQIDGHHLNVSCFVLGDQIVLTPAFMGSEPVLAETGKYAGTRVLFTEEQHGLELIRSLSSGQLARAAIVDPEAARTHGFEGRLLSGALRDNLVLPQEGILAAELSEGQRSLLMQLVETFVGHMRPEHDQIKLNEVKQHLDETSLFWLGGIDDDAVFYYRIHSPVILIEFDHQRGIAFANDAPSRNHIHTIVRTPNGNDYGKDLLRQHYAEHHNGGDAR